MNTTMTRTLVILCMLGAATLPFAPIATRVAPTNPPVTVGVTKVERPDTSVAADPRADRTFHPDSNALTPAQMVAAWQAEIDRLFPPVMAGGG